MAYREAARWRSGNSTGMKWIVSYSQLGPVSVIARRLKLILEGNCRIENWLSLTFCLELAASHYHCHYVNMDSFLGLSSPEDDQGHALQPAYASNTHSPSEIPFWPRFPHLLVMTTNGSWAMNSRPMRYWKLSTSAKKCHFIGLHHGSQRGWNDWNFAQTDKGIRRRARCDRSTPDLSTGVWDTDQSWFEEEENCTR